MTSRSRSRNARPDDAPIAPVVGDIITFDTRADTDVFHILGDSPSRTSSPVSSAPAARIPWYKTPSPLWLVPTIILSAVLMGATIPLRTELYIKLACNELRPDYLFVPPPPPIFLGLDPSIPTNPEVPIYVPSPPDKPSINLPAPNKLCNSDPKVQSAVAKLSTAMTTSMGILSCVTTGSWSQLSDRIGRTRVMAIAGLGVLFTDMVLILVAFYADVLPGGYRFLIIGSILDGALGGWTTAMATTHAYVSDTVGAATRSRIFSLFTGGLFIGMALGPTIGAMITQHTNNLLTVFYIGAGLHTLNTILCISILPESLTKKERAAAKERHLASQSVNRLGRLGIAWSMVTTFAHPLVIFIPRRTPKGRDWSLTLVGVAYGTAMLNMGSYAFKFQYAITAFGWGTIELGYWMSLIGVTRATHLVILLPLFIKFLHMLYSRGSPTARKHTHLDLLVSRISLFLEIMGYIVTALIVSPTAFVIATCWLAVGGGFSPAVQSLALALRQEQHDKDKSKLSEQRYDSTTTEERPTSPAASASETGRLFGALSVLQSLTSQIIGPSLFGVVFINTIGNAPRAIFWLSAACVGSALLALSMIRLDTDEPRGDVTEEADERSRLLA